MKAILIILVIIAMIWGLNAYTTAFIDGSSTKMLAFIDKAETAAKNGDMYTVNEQIGILRDEWEAVESRWEVLEDHREIDRIDTLMTHLEAMAGTGSLDELMPDLQELAFFLTHIDDKHKIRMENIL